MYFYPDLGKNGRFGNQMFQYATLVSVARFNNSKAGVPIDVGSENDSYSRIHIYDAFPNLTAEKVTVDVMNSAKHDYIAKEGIDFNFEPSVFSSRDDCRLSGYFQSEKYFDMIRDEIKKEFAFHDDVQSKCKEVLDELKSTTGGSKLCAVHFRRGDYTKLGHVHTNLDASYYNPAFSWAMNNIKGCKFVAFSDDIQWCKDNLPSDFLIPESQSMFHDMCLMSMCDAHIIANSSFSWWGAWLADNSIQVIAPKNWFASEGPKNWDTIYCKNWGLI